VRTTYKLTFRFIFFLKEAITLASAPGDAWYGQDGGFVEMNIVVEYLS
jgi:hypothetical protein